MNFNAEPLIYKNAFLKKYSVTNVQYYGNIQFTFGNVKREDFNQEYYPEGWLGRKVTALPFAIWSGVIKTTYHLVKAIFIGIPKAFSDKGRYLKLEFLHIGRDFQAAYGRLALLVNDKYGLFHIQESQFQKSYYDSLANKGTPRSIMQNRSTLFSSDNKRNQGPDESSEEPSLDLEHILADLNTNSATGGTSNQVYSPELSKSVEMSKEQLQKSNAKQVCSRGINQ